MSALAGVEEVSGPTLIAEVGTVYVKPGVEYRVSIKDAGSGPAVDVREYLTTPPSVRKPRAYVGPTKKGLWLQPSQAESLCELIAQAVVSIDY